MRKSRFVVLYILVFSVICPAGAQNRALTGYHVNPKSHNTIIHHPVNSIFAAYYFDVVTSHGSSVRQAQRLKPVSTTQGGGGDLVEERFITSDSALQTQSPYYLYIDWDHTQDNGDLCPDGEYSIRIFETKGLTRTGISSRYEYKVTIDTTEDYFDIEFATREISKNSNGVMFVSAVLKNSAEKAYANKWSIRIRDKASEEIVMLDSLEASSPNDVIPLEYAWYDFNFIKEFGTYDFKIEVISQDRAGNSAYNFADFIILYEIDYRAYYFSENQKLVETINSLENANKSREIYYTTENQRLKENVHKLELLNETQEIQNRELREIINTMESDSRLRETVDTVEKESPSAYGEIFKMNVRAFGGYIEISGEFNEEKGFIFLFAYRDIPKNAEVKNVTIDAYDENGKKIASSFSGDSSGAEWNGTNSTESLVITSNTTYKFDFTFQNSKNEKFSASNHITTGLVTKRNTRGEYLVLLPGIYFPGFEADIVKSGPFLPANMNSVWRAASLLKRYADRYESLIIRGYANYTTYPNRTRMNMEQPVLLEYSRQRAESVRNLLIAFDVPPEKIKIEGMGWNDPVVLPDKNDNYRNRRIELYLKYKER
jgi:outer membrane protein OmpA-like peptidoglycan-associated protein